MSDERNIDRFFEDSLEGVEPKGENREDKDFERLAELDFTVVSSGGSLVPAGGQVHRSKLNNGALYSNKRVDLYHCCCGHILSLKNPEAGGICAVTGRLICHREVCQIRCYKCRRLVCAAHADYSCKDQEKT